MCKGEEEGRGHTLDGFRHDCFDKPYDKVSSLGQMRQGWRHHACTMLSASTKPKGIIVAVTVVVFCLVGWCGFFVSLFVLVNLTQARVT